MKELFFKTLGFTLVVATSYFFVGLTPSNWLAYSASIFAVGYIILGLVLSAILLGVAYLLVSSVYGYEEDENQEYDLNIFIFALYSFIAFQLGSFIFFLN